MTGKLASRVRGLGEAEFQAAYGTEERCRTAVEELRWPEGFACPVCGGREGTRLSTRPKIQCASCRHQTSSTAGTIFASTKLPLTRWFLAIRLIATAAEGITSVELGRRLGIKQTNAWALKRRHRQVDAGEDKEAPSLIGATASCGSLDARDLSPDREGLRADRSVLAGGEVIAVEMKEVVDLVVGREEALRLAG